jgi:diguanylate cyclase (GGDEF)-like protein
MVALDAFLIGCFIVMSIYHFFLYYFYKENYGALFFAFITLGATILSIFRNTELTIKLPISILVFTWVPLFYTEFTRIIFEEEFKDKLTKTLIHGARLFAAIYSVVTVVVYLIKMDRFMEIYNGLTRPVLGVMILHIGLIMIKVIMAAIHKRQDSYFLLIGYGVLFIGTFLSFQIPVDTFNQNNPVGALGILLLYSIALARRFSNAYFECEKVVDQRTSELSQKNQELEKILNFDMLTGAATRRHTFQVLETSFQEAKEQQATLAVMAMDLDHFKKINDTYGHAMGDYVLKETTALMIQYIGDKGVVGRVGGEEFLIVMSNIPKEMAISYAEELLHRISSHNFQLPIDKTIHVTCSFGVAEYQLGCRTYDDLLRIVDEKLYVAKETGRNSVCH